MIKPDDLFYAQERIKYLIAYANGASETAKRQADKKAWGYVGSELEDVLRVLSKQSENNAECFLVAPNEESAKKYFFNRQKQKFFLMAREKARSLFTLLAQYQEELSDHELRIRKSPKTKLYVEFNKFEQWLNNKGFYF